MFKSFTTSQTKPTSYREEIVARKRLYRPYVTDGLKVYYDFANRASQQSGIARAYNLAGDDATAIHYNSPTYTVDGALTHMLYDGVDDYSRTGNFTNNSTGFLTIETVMSFGNFTDTEYVFQATGATTFLWKTAAGGGQIGQIGIGTGSGEMFGMFAPDWISAGVTADINNFNHIVFVIGDNSSKAKIYVNGVQQTLQFTRGVLNGNYRNTALMTDWSMGGSTSGSVPTNMGLAEFKIYDRELSAREVAYNYGVAKSRKGV
jgi:hypothetical protein